jgi:hypothetical protein
MNASTDKPGGAGRDPAELEREADQIRADMDRTLDALERKLSPSQLLDRSLVYLREHGGDLARDVGDTVKNNPVPVIMAVAGIGWLVASTLRSGSHTLDDMTLGDMDDSDIDDSFDDESPYAERPRGLRGVADVTREQTRMAQDRIETLVSERPLLLGGIAVAIGALIGALIPATEYEDRTVGQVRDRAVQRAREAGERQYRNLRSKLEPHRDIEVSGQAH